MALLTYILFLWGSPPPAKKVLCSVECATETVNDMFPSGHLCQRRYLFVPPRWERVDGCVSKPALLHCDPFRHITYLFSQEIAYNKNGNLTCH